MAMRFKKEKKNWVLNLDGHFLTVKHFERLRNGRQPQLAVGPSVLVIRMRCLTFVFPLSYHSQRLFVITSGIDDVFCG